MRRTVQLLFFAWVKERVGAGEQAFELPADVDTVAMLVEALKQCGPGFEAAFAVPKLVRAAVNQEFAAPDTPVKPGDEIAFFPPMTGG